MAELKAVLRLGDIGGEWNVFRVSDAEVCAFSNKLNDVYPAAFDYIFADPFYQLTRTRMISQYVDWDNFILLDLNPALGVHAKIEPCNTLNIGGVVRFRQELKSFVGEDLIDATIVRLRQESSAFNDWQVAVAKNQAAVPALRCSSSVQKVFTVMYSQQVDLEFVLNIFLRVLFGGASAAVC